MPPTTDDVEQARLGDTEAFRRLYLASADRIHRLARWLLGTPDVDDVVQDVYVRVWERLPGLRDPRTFDSWLRQLAVNVILRYRERAARAGDREAPLENAGPADRERSAPDGLRLDLERAIARLPARAREVFVLYDVEGHQHSEIATLLAISSHTSRSQLHRARSLLKGFLE